MPTLDLPAVLAKNPHLDQERVRGYLAYVQRLTAFGLKMAPEYHPESPLDVLIAGRQSQQNEPRPIRYFL